MTGRFAGARFKAVLVFPPGCGTAALRELSSIVGDPWHRRNTVPTIEMRDGFLFMSRAHLLHILEVLFRSCSLSDVRLVLKEKRVESKDAFGKACAEIPWNEYLPAGAFVRISADSVASRVFHEGALEELAAESLRRHGFRCGGEGEPLTTVYVRLYRNRLTVSVSLAGAALYKRGYRADLQAAAPLREDMAWCMLSEALTWLGSVEPGFSPHTVFIPFSGSGTFLFEYIMYRYAFPGCVFGRPYAAESFPFYTGKNAAYLRKKAEEPCDALESDVSFLCMDTSEKALGSFRENRSLFERVLPEPCARIVRRIPIHVGRDDFFSCALDLLRGSARDVFIPMNPPYGIRLSRRRETAVFYADIGGRIREIASVCTDSGGSVGGCILCPDQAAWSAFLHAAAPDAETTFHVTQGGLDIRVCVFYKGRRREL